MFSWETNKECSITLSWLLIISGPANLLSQTGFPLPLVLIGKHLMLFVDCRGRCVSALLIGAHNINWPNLVFFFLLSVSVSLHPSSLSRNDPLCAGSRSCPQGHFTEIFYSISPPHSPSRLILCYMFSFNRMHMVHTHLQTMTQAFVLRCQKEIAFFFFKCTSIFIWSKDLAIIQERSISAPLFHENRFEIL